VPKGVFNVEEKSKIVGYQCLPHQTKTEGFFICAFRKLQKVKRNSPKFRKKQAAENNAFFDVNAYFQENFEGKKLIMNALMVDDYCIIKDNLYLKKAGINLGENIYNQFNPTPESAFCNLPKKSISNYNCSLHEALKFLNKSLLQTENEINKGWILMQYNGISIGWIKNIGNRFNNYYPSEWRIIKQLPENFAE
jgi:NOL1/NOP2/fmu family ribosome biogenesis protein